MIAEALGETSTPCRTNRRSEIHAGDESIAANLLERESLAISPADPWTKVGKKASA